jgi:uncharacterized protein YndB with AHSA1/START domain
MARVRVTTMLAAPPREVWADLEDISTHPEWMADAVGIRFLTEQRTGVGTRFECDTKVGPFRLTDVMEITEWVPGKVMGVAHSGVVTGSGRLILRKARGGRTQLQWKERLHFPKWMGGPVGAYVAKPVLTWVWRRSMANLQARFPSDGQDPRT